MAPAQPRLFDLRMGAYDPASLVVSPECSGLAERLEHWDRWPQRAMILLGPPGSGKTHWASAWAAAAGAVFLDPAEPAERAFEAFEAGARKAVLDGAPLAWGEMALFRWLESVKAAPGALLITAADPPAAWGVGMPDLASRLAAAGLAEIPPPSREMLRLLLRRHCRERFIILGQEAEDYLMASMPPNAAFARSLADAMEAGAARASRPVALSQARAALRAARNALEQAP